MTGSPQNLVSTDFRCLKNFDFLAQFQKEVEAVLELEQDLNHTDEECK